MSHSSIQIKQRRLIQCGSIKAGITLAVVIALGPASDESLANKYAGAPFSIGVGARALGRGGALVAAPGSAASLFWNPAALAALDRIEIMAQHTEAFGSLLNHDFVAVAFPPPPDRSGWAWGVALYSLSGGGIALTEIDQSTGRPVVDATRGHGHYAVSASIVRAGSIGSSEDSWQYGIAAAPKVLFADVPDGDAWGVGLNAAGWLAHGIWSAGLQAADITTSFLRYSNDRTETINPHIRAGAQITPYTIPDRLITTFIVESEFFFENRREGSQYWSGPLSVDTHFGAEVIYRETLSLRAGANAGSLAFGAGLRIGQATIDVALTDHDFLDTSYRVSAAYAWR